MTNDKLGPRHPAHECGHDCDNLGTFQKKTRKDSGSLNDLSDQTKEQLEKGWWENGQPTNLRTLKSLHEFFVMSGLEVAFKEIVKGDQDVLSKAPVDLHRLLDIVSIWFDQIFQERALDLVNYLVEENVTYCLNGKAGTGRDSLRDHLNVILQKNVKTYANLLQICASDDRVMVQWRSRRNLGIVLSSQPAQLKSKAVLGITSFRISAERIAEVWEFSQDIPQGQPDVVWRDAP